MLKFPTPASILVVDDESSICRLVATVLEARGHSVLQAKSGSQALEIAAGRTIDLVITDIRMHGMDGMSLAGKLASTRPHLKIIFMSGYFGDGDACVEKVPVSWEYISKPFSLSELLALVYRVLVGDSEAASLGRQAPSHPAASPLLPDTVQETEKRPERIGIRR